MTKLELIDLQNGVAVVLPKDVLERLELHAGDALYIAESAAGELRLVAHGLGEAEREQRTKDIVERYRDTLSELAK